MAMNLSKNIGYGWAVSAGLNAAFAAISAKFIGPQLFRYAMAIFFNVVMWGCYVNSLKALSSSSSNCHQLCNQLSVFWFSWIFPLSGTTITQGALLIVVGVFVLSRSSIEEKKSKD